VRSSDVYHGLIGTWLRERFVLTEFMDKGGMGAVFRAFDHERQEVVAVKVLHPKLAEEDKCLARFIRESEAAMVLNHPHIVETLSMSGPGEELAWFAMELLEGSSLQHLNKRGHRFTPSEVARIGRQVLAALSAAHEIGLMHRDVKPANIMVERGPEGVHAKLVDFGIAVFARSDTYTRLTTQGTILGTPTYMPPEQLAGKHMDERTDVYALSATLHRLLTGEPPFGKGSLAKVLPKILSGDRISIPERFPEHAALGTVIERGLALTPEGRWQTARAMADALAPFDERASVPGGSWRPASGPQTVRLRAFTLDGDQNVGAVPTGDGPTAQDGDAGATQGSPATQELSPPPAQPPARTATRSGVSWLLAAVFFVLAAAAATAAALLIG